MNRSLFHQLHDRCPIVQRNTNEWNKHVRIRAVFHNNLPIVSSTAGEVFYDISSNVFIVALYKNALDFVSVQITPRRLLRGPSIDSNFLLFESIINSVVRLPRSRGIFESRVISKFGTCQFEKTWERDILNRSQVSSRCLLLFPDNGNECRPANLSSFAPSFPSLPPLFKQRFETSKFCWKNNSRLTQKFVKSKMV